MAMGENRIRILLVDDEKEAKRLGAYDYPEKPVEVDTLWIKFGAPIKTESKIR